VTAKAKDRADAQTFSRRSLERTRGAGESKKTVLVALAANGVIALAKLAGGLMTGSAAMLAEAAHSTADTTHQGFLLTSILLSRREPSPERPFGHGQERYLWTFLAATAMFVAGATFAIGFGAFELLSGGGDSGAFLIAYVVLAVAFLAEGTSFVRALRQARSEAREAAVPTLEHIRRSRDPSMKMVLFEDSAALVGVVLAFAGLLADQITGSTFFDPLASILIGCLLVGVAMRMARDSSHMLIGSPALPEEHAEIERAIESFDEIDDVVELLTMVLSPNALLVAARVDLRDEIDGGRVEDVSTRIDRRIRELVPDVTEVFLDATTGRNRA
jgi:cation diffusion facilitator family transporter